MHDGAAAATWIIMGVALGALGLTCRGFLAIFMSAAVGASLWQSGMWGGMW